MPDDNAIKQTELARASKSSSISQLLSLLYPFLVCVGILYTYTGIQQQPNHTWYEYVVVEHLPQYREHSTAQRSHPCTKRQTKYVPISVSNRVNMYAPSCGVRVCWRRELLAFSDRLFTQKMFDHLLHMSFRSILPCERAGRAESPATRSAF